MKYTVAILALATSAFAAVAKRDGSGWQSQGYTSTTCTPVTTTQWEYSTETDYVTQWQTQTDYKTVEVWETQYVT